MESQRLDAPMRRLPCPGLARKDTITSKSRHELDVREGFFSSPRPRFTCAHAYFVFPRFPLPAQDLVYISARWRVLHKA
jgi:hypothetical protein